MLVRCWDNACPRWELTDDGIPSANLDEVFFRDKTHYAHPTTAVIGQQFVYHVPVLATNRLTQCLGAALVPAADHEQVGMFTERLFPHLFRCVSFFAVAFFPVHASLSRSVEIIIGLWFLARSQSHMGGDDSPPLGIFLEHVIGPVQYFVRGVAFQV